MLVKQVNLFQRHAVPLFIFIISQRNSSQSAKLRVVFPSASARLQSDRVRAQIYIIN